MGPIDYTLSPLLMPMMERELGDSGKYLVMSGKWYTYFYQVMSA